ncbi:MAG TPA: ABC transporter permease subunit [Pseudonocardiaceae bacterium]|jgi:ABC-type transport system involved in multi-copper enzyme maturation permease subunit/regulation of enolase protein 1 (concanavalin A-like superfamily)
MKDLLHAEWTKFRTVRGWGIGMLVAVALTVLIGLLGPAATTISCQGPDGQACVKQAPPTGPDGEVVDDSFYFVHQPLTGDGTISARVTSLTGLYAPGGTRQAGVGTAGMRPGVQPWTKAGIIVKDGTRQGSQYAAVMVTGGNGVRMQSNYIHDTAGTAGPWLRLTRTGDTLTGYSSVNGTQWTRIGAASLSGLPSTVQIGLFVTSPGYTVITQSFGGGSSRGGPTTATAGFDQVSPGGTWTGEAVGGQVSLSPGFQRAGDTFTLTGSGDIAPSVAGRGDGARIEDTLVGAFAGLIVIVVVATMFMTGEYRRGLIRTTFAASPWRGRVLAAKAVVIGAVTFVTGLVAAAVAVPLVRHFELVKGFTVLPVSVPTELRVMIGVAALLAVAAVLALAVGTLVRRSAGAVTAVIVAIVLPYILAVASVLPAGAAEWLTRFTPAAAFAIEQSMPAYPQVTASYTPADGYFPLSPLAGFAVLCGYAALALGAAFLVLRRRDA